MTQLPDHSSRGHAEFSPSSLKYVASCPGYQGRVETNEAAERGTRIHEALEVRNSVGLLDEEEMEIYLKTIEMEDALIAQFDAELVELGLEPGWGQRAEDYREIQLDIPLRWGLATWGTCDRMMVDGEGPRALMIDYKTGISEIDPPEDNYQAMAYVLGAFEKFPGLDSVTFAFLVPVRDSVLVHTFDRAADYYPLRDKLTSVVREATRVRPHWENGTPPLEDLRPNQHCRFCAHEDGRCPAIGGLVREVANKVSPGLPDADFENPTTPEDIETLYKIAKIVEGWAERFKSRAVELAKLGMEFPTLRLRSMGAPTFVADKKAYVDELLARGVPIEAILEAATIPVGKSADLVASSPDVAKGKKAAYKKVFLDDCEQSGIVARQPERFTLS